MNTHREAKKEARRQASRKSVRLLAGARTSGDGLADDRFVSARGGFDVDIEEEEEDDAFVFTGGDPRRGASRPTRAMSAKRLGRLELKLDTLKKALEEEDGDEEEGGGGGEGEAEAEADPEVGRGGGGGAGRGESRVSARGARGAGGKRSVCIKTCRRRFHFFIPPPRRSEHLASLGARKASTHLEPSSHRAAPTPHGRAREQDAFEPDRTVEMKVTFKTLCVIPPAAHAPAAPRDRPLFPDRRDVAARGQIAAL